MNDLQKTAIFTITNSIQKHLDVIIHKLALNIFKQRQLIFYEFSTLRVNFHKEQILNLYGNE